MFRLRQTYKLFEKRKTNLSFLIVICFLIQVPSFSAILETNLERTDQTLCVRIFMSTLPEEEVSGIQLEYGYDMQNWEFASASPAETLYTSDKQLQIAPGNGVLRILIIGLNNYPIPSGELLTLYFNASSEVGNTTGFRILNIKLSSPEALSVSGIINNKEGEETSTDSSSEFEKETNAEDTDSSTPSMKVSHPLHIKLPEINSTNHANLYKERVTNITSTYPQNANISSAKSYNQVSAPAGYFPEANNSYVHNQKYKENKKTERKTSFSNLIPILQKPSVTEIQNISSVPRTILTDETNNTFTRKTNLTPVLRNTQTHKSILARKLDTVSEKIKDTYSSTNSRLSIDQSQPNAYLALNFSNLPATRGRSNECTHIIGINLSIQNISQKENILAILVAIIITVLIPLTLLPAILRKSLFPTGKDSEKEK